MRRSVAGWFPDPVTLGAARYWDGSRWTSYVAYRDEEYESSVPIPTVERASDRADADVVRCYLADALARGTIDAVTAAVLRDDLDRHLAGHAPEPGIVKRHVTGTDVTAPAAVEPAAVEPAAVEPAAVEPVRVPVDISPPLAEARPTEPEPAVVRTAAVHVEPHVGHRWWEQARDAVMSDLAVHGLAYLGVILLFAGVFGLIVFSSGEVPPHWRLIADAAAPTAFFVSAWYLRRRGATHVAAALSLLGGAILPIVALASLTDGYSVPPDVTGAALPIVQAAVCALISIGMILVVRRDPQSMLRFLAVPTMWLGVGVLAGLTRDPIPTGEAVAHATAVQLTAMLVAIAVTAVVLRGWSNDHPLRTATDAVALPLAGVVYVLAQLLAGGEGWPLLNGLVAAGAAFVIVEMYAARLNSTAVALTEVVIVAAAAMPLFARLDLGWAGLWMFAAMLALVELTAIRHPSRVGIAAAAAGAVVGLVLSGATAGSGSLAFTVAAAWLVWRRATAPSWFVLRDRNGIGPALLLLVAYLELVRLSGGEPWPAVVAAAVALAAAIGRRRFRRMADDRLWTWWSPTVAITAVYSTAGFALDEQYAVIAVVTALGAATVATSAIRLAIRTWLTSAMVLWLLVDLALLADIGRDTTAILIAAIAATTVGVAIFVDGVVPAHVGYFGALVGLALIGVPTDGTWTLTTVMAISTLAWVATTAVHELSGAAFVERIGDALPRRTTRRAIDSVPMMIGAVGVGATVIVALDTAGAIPYDSPWYPVRLFGAALLYAALTRVVPWRRANPLALGVLALLVSLSAIVITAGWDDRPWARIAALAAGAVVAMLCAPRPAPFVWVAVAETAPLTVLLAQRVGVDAEWSEVAYAAWGAAALLAAATARRLMHRPLLAIVGDTPLAAPTVLGTVAFVAGGTLGMEHQEPATIGWIALVMSAVVLAEALLLPLAPLSAAAELLATFGLARLITWGPYEHPWSVVPWAAALLAVAWLLWRTRERHAGRRWWTRWDLPSFVAGHVVAGSALVATVVFGSVPATFLSTAALSAAVGAVLANPVWFIAAAALVLVGAQGAGLGWLALALTLEGLAALVIAARRQGPVRTALLAIGAAMEVAAWVTFITWVPWSTLTLVAVSAPTAAVVALGTAVAIGQGRQPRDLLVAIAGTGAAIAIGTVGLLDGPDSADWLAGGLIVSAAWAVLAVAIAATAPVWGMAARWATVGTLAAAGAMFWFAVQPGPVALALGATTVAVGLCVVLLLVHAAHPTTEWLLPGAVLALGVQLVGLDGLLVIDPIETAHATALLLALAAESAMASVFLARRSLMVATPVLACAAWVVYAVDALRGEPNWIAAPVGFTVLVVAGLVRWIRRGRGGAVTGTDVAVLEYVGMAIIVAPPLVQTVATNLWYALLAIAEGTALAAWGAATRVRRRAGFGMLAATVATVLLIGVPLARAVPSLHGPSLWLAVAAIGAVAIVVATWLEQGRRTVRRLTEALDEMTETWEHTGGPDVRRTGRPGDSAPPSDPPSDPSAGPSGGPSSDLTPTGGGRRS